MKSFESENGFIAVCFSPDRPAGRTGLPSLLGPLLDLAFDHFFSFLNACRLQKVKPLIFPNGFASLAPHVLLAAATGLSGGFRNIATADTKALLWPGRH